MGSLLPPGLIDLTLHRATMASYGSSFLRRGFAISRTLKSAETTSSSSSGQPPAFVDQANNWTPQTNGRQHRSLTTIKGRPRIASEALQQLDERVRALEVVTQVEEATIYEPFYTELELAALYQDILANPFEDDSELRVNEQAMRRAQRAEDTAIVQAMYERFDGSAAASSSAVGELDSAGPYQIILFRLDSIVSRLEAAQRVANAEAANEEQQNFPISILTLRECEALVRVAIKSADSPSAELTLDLMKRTGLPVPETAITDILQLYAKTGDAAAADHILAKFLKGPPNQMQRHLQIQSHLRATPSNVLPMSALDVLHSYEGQALPAPMQTYTSVITSLFSLPSSIARGQAWDLFSHMRYVAHPDPDTLLYTLMIRACASPLSSTLSSEPEKALDLWTEMTVDHRLTPTVGAYNAVILACARAGTKDFVAEAFRIARQMLDSHRDAEGRSAYRPDRKTFCALLEGAKRIGDLNRVRWILAEMTRSRSDLETFNAPVNAEVDEEVMLHVFNAYAAYRPPFIRANIPVANGNANKAGKKSEQAPEPAPTSLNNPDHPLADGAQSQEAVVSEEQPAPSFAHISPQTHNEVLQEVKFLFQSIRDAQSTSVDPSRSPETPMHKFRGVAMTTRLVTAYLSVFYNHSSLATSRDLFWKIYDDLGLERSVRAYIEALERCGNARKNGDGGHERELALQFAEELWKDWSAIEQRGEHQGRRLDSRMIERAHVAMIRVLTLTNQLDRAMDVVKAFADRYQPQAVRRPPPKPFLRSTRTLLSAARPLVRMTSATDVPDDFVPPMLWFKDVEALHHRLVAYGRYKDIGYLKWLCKAYEWALRVRRDETTKAVPEPDQGKIPVVA